MKSPDVFSLLGQIGGSLVPLYRDKVRAKQDELGLSQDRPEYFWLAVTLDFDPEPVSAAKFGARTPYANPAGFEDGLRSLAECGWLESAGDEEYTLTAEGRHILDTVYGVLEAELRALEPLPDADLQRIKALLGKLVDAAVAAPEPASKMHLLYNRHSDPGEAGPVLLNILQYGADLNAFRDDAHLAAFMPQNVSGQAWEALTLIWRDGAHTAAELAEKLSYRNYDAGAYAAALNELAARGWVQADGDHYTITGAGATMRQGVEDETDRLYYAAWSSLSEAETTELGELMTQLISASQAMQESVEATT